MNNKEKNIEINLLKIENIKIKNLLNEKNIELNNIKKLNQNLISKLIHINTKRYKLEKKLTI